MRRTLCLLLLALWGLGGTIDLHAALPDSARHEIYVVGHGWHAGIVVSKGAIPLEAWPEQQDFPDAAFLEVGWGDAAYYQHPDPGIGLALRAALWPTPSVLHIVGMDRPAPAYFPQSTILRVMVTADGLEALGAFFHHAYAQDEQGIVQRLGAGLYGTSRFYEGRERYHLFRNCNAWVAEALRIAGVPLSKWGIFTVGQLLGRVQDVGTVVQEVD